MRFRDSKSPCRKWNVCDSLQLLWGLKPGTPLIEFFQHHIILSTLSRYQVFNELLTHKHIFNTLKWVHFLLTPDAVVLTLDSHKWTLFYTVFFFWLRIKYLENLSIFYYLALKYGLIWHKNVIVFISRIRIYFRVTLICFLLFLHYSPSQTPSVFSNVVKNQRIKWKLYWVSWGRREVRPQCARIVLNRLLFLFKVEPDFMYGCHTHLLVPPESHSLVYAPSHYLQMSKPISSKLDVNPKCTSFLSYFYPFQIHIASWLSDTKTGWFFFNEIECEKQISWLNSRVDVGKYGQHRCYIWNFKPYGKLFLEW